MGPQGAICFHTLTPISREISKAQWDVERFGQLCTQPQNFADLKAVIEKLCRETGNCFYKKELDQFFKKVESIPRE